MVFPTLVLGIYCLLVIVLWIGWNRSLISDIPQKVDSMQKISVIVPIRNDVSTITALLDSLKRQHFKNFEVIIVDDHSEDGVVEIIRQHPLENLIVLENDGTGKKMAIATGVKIAKGSIIVTTDADCSVPESWLQTIQDTFSDEQIKLAFGGVAIKQHSFFSILQSIEFAGLIGSGAAAASFGKPTMCNGANLAYRRNVFLEVHGYEGNLEVASGDDEFLMRKIHERYQQGIRFIGTPAAVVVTLAQTDLRSFFRQRLRWASKWRYNSSRITILLALFIVVTQVSTVASIGCLLYSFSYLLLLSLLSKALIEYFFLNRVCRFLGVSWNWPAFLILQVVYPVYVIGVGVVSNFKSNSWKGRKIN
jgi:biofilm PGA synthesis N-glycosyltransferase PgaC